MESIVMRELVQDLPLEELRMKKTRTEHLSRNRSKPFSNKKGDVLNLHKTKASSDEEKTSDEEADSSDDEEGPTTYPKHAKGEPWDAASSVLSSNRRGFPSIKVWCPTEHTGSRRQKR
jgi:hypothetical protein